MPYQSPAFWKKAPFTRLLLPLISGILLQWYGRLPLALSILVIAGSSLLFILLSMLRLFSRFKYGGLTGATVFILLASLGALLTYRNDIRNDKRWFGHYYNINTEVQVTLQEPLVEKTNSYKAIASVNKFSGNIIIYFQKDSSFSSLTYGSQIVFHSPLQEIKNSGNPGGFDYKRYCLFQNISHQVYLKPGDFTLLPGKSENGLDKLLLSISKWTIAVLQKFIPGVREQGLAEALLIGYKNDLDKSLVQSYTNTGVVHVIAISGLHLALVYWLLLKLLLPLKRIKRLRWLHSVIAIATLWLFSLLAGAQASILRAAVMFTLVILAELVARKPNIINSLAASAFLMLCYNPFWLWDVGFQLSYAALLSLAIFMQPIYSLCWFQNRTLNFVWGIAAASIAAQILTTPISIYHFHQLPSLFLFSNFLAVPLSSLVVLAEIFLCAFSWLHPLAVITGKFIAALITVMNTWIERIESIPYSLWDGLQVTILQSVLLFVLIAGIGYWLLAKTKFGLWTGLAALLLFISLRSYSFIEADHQQRLIVYNVSKHSAIDFITGRNYYFIGDSILLQDDFLRNFNLKPSRILHRIKSMQQLPGLSVTNNYINWRDKRILIIDQPVVYAPTDSSITVDLLIVSKKASLSFYNLLQAIAVKQIVFDASLPYKKIKQWITECDSLHLSYHNVTDKGAYILNLK